MIDPVRYAWESLNSAPFPEVLGIPCGARGGRHGFIGSLNDSNKFMEDKDL